MKTSINLFGKPQPITTTNQQPTDPENQLKERIKELMLKNEDYDNYIEAFPGCLTFLQFYNRFIDRLLAQYYDYLESEKYDEEAAWHRFSESYVYGPDEEPPE